MRCEKSAKNTEVIHTSVNFPPKKFPRNSISEKYINHSGSIYGRHPSNLLNYESCEEKSADLYVRSRRGFRDEIRVPEFSRTHFARCLPLGNEKENVARIHLRGRHSSPKTRYIFLFVAAQYFRRSRENVYARRIPKGIAFLRPSRIPPCRRGDIESVSSFASTLVNVLLLESRIP